MRGTDYVFHLAALWLYECVHEPRKALEAQRRRHLQRRRGGAGGRRQEGRLLVVGIGLRQRGRRADDRGPPVQQPDDVRRDEDRRRAVLPRLPRAARARLRGAPLHEHLRAAHGLQGHVRERDHEGARPHRRGPAAAHLRRRLADLRLRPRRGRRPGQHPRAQDRRDRHVLQRRHRRRDDDQASSSTMLLEITGSDIEPEYLPQEEVFVTHRVGSTELAERAARLPRARWTCARVSSRSSSGGAPTSAAARRAD